MKSRHKGVAPVTVTQQEIEVLLGLEVLIRQRWDIYRQEARGIISRLEAGATVEGGRHTARIERMRYHGRSVPVLVLDGHPGLLERILAARKGIKI